MSPVLAYIEKGEYKDQDISWLNKKWVSKTLYNFGLVRKKLHDNKKIASIAWQNYFSNLISNNSISPERSGGYRTNPATPPTDPCTSDPDYYLFVNQTVSPLLTTNWGQGTSYNNLLTTCSPEIFPLVGGASVAMGQIMHYYQYPSSAYGHTYNYSAMPSASGNIYNQTLLTDIMNSIGARPCFDGDLASEGYNPNSYGHSGTSVHVTISNSFKSSFYYSYADDADYTIGTDYSNVTSNLFVNKPVLLIGYFDEDCTSGIFTVPLGVPHYWVCDGLNQSNITFCSSGSSTTEQILYFHMNFGDNEIDATTSFTRTGWYAFSDWTLPGYGGPTYYNEIVYNIHW